MAKLELFLLGPPRPVRDGVPLQFDTRKIMALVAYLAVSGLESAGARFSRESLLALPLFPRVTQVIHLSHSQPYNEPITRASECGRNNL